MYFFMVNRLDVCSGRIHLSMQVIVGDAAASKYGAQVHIPAQIFAGIVQSTAKTQVAILRVNKQIHTIQSIALCVVLYLFAAADKIFVGMLSAETVVITADCQRSGHQIAEVLDNNLAFREIVNQSFNRAFWPGSTNVRVDRFHQSGELRVVG